MRARVPINADEVEGSITVEGPSVPGSSFSIVRPEVKSSRKGINEQGRKSVSFGSD